MAEAARENGNKDGDQPMDDGPDTSTVAREGLLACDRCRRRKVKCARGAPCRQCEAAGAQCTYDLGYKPRARRQRVMVSNDLETNVEHIARTVDELKEMIEDLEARQSQLISTSHPSRPAASPHQIQASRPPEAPSTATTQPSPASGRTPGATSAGPDPASQNEYLGESSLFAHALFASTFLQNAVGGSSSFEVSAEMGPVMNTLRSIADAQKQSGEAIDLLFPHARPLQDGRKPKDFETPPTDKIFACLRRIQECHEVQVLWLIEFEDMGHFTEYIIKVCSPGPATEAELIIVNAGLYWMFLECASIAEDEDEMLDFESQAMLCRSNLETLLAHLGFHTPLTLDNIYAFHMAATYCLQILKTSAAWGFVGTAAYLCEALGLHRGVSLHRETIQQKRRKARLFWVVYTTEKPLSLRVGRSSHLRDSDITIPRPEQPQGPDSLINRILPIWVDMGCLQGRVYDEIYSPGAFVQPGEVRHARAHSLIDSVNALMEAEKTLERDISVLCITAPPTRCTRMMWLSDRITNYSMLTLLYRSLPSSDPSTSSLRAECVEMARKSLKEHEACLTLLSSEKKTQEYLSLFINWGLLQMPFVPFTILFCHIIESSSASDLKTLGDFLQTQEDTSILTGHASIMNQLRLFHVLHSVAVKYVSVKENSTSRYDQYLNASASSKEGPGSDWTVPPSQGTPASGLLSDAPGMAGAAGLPGGIPGSQAYVGSYADSAAHLTGEDQFMASLGEQMDSSGGILANWFTSNQQLMMMLENT